MRDARRCEMIPRPKSFSGIFEMGPGGVLSAFARGEGPVDLSQRAALTDCWKKGHYTNSHQGRERATHGQTVT